MEISTLSETGIYNHIGNPSLGKTVTGPSIRQN